MALSLDTKISLGTAGPVIPRQRGVPTPRLKTASSMLRHATARTELSIDFNQRKASEIVSFFWRLIPGAGRPFHEMAINHD